MNNKNNDTICIIGAGLGGSFLALSFAKKGYTVDVYERYTEEEIMESYTSSKSYNLTFYDYAVNVFKKTGIWESLKPNLVKLTGSVNQITNNPPRTIETDPYFAVQRDDLLQTLIKQALTYPSVTFHYGSPLVSINRQEKTIIVKNLKKNTYETVSCDVIFGADGVNSQVRTLLQLGQKSSHIQEYADWEYKQIHIDKNAGKLLHMQPHFMYAWTRKDMIVLAHPNKDESFSTMLILPKKQKVGFHSLDSSDAIKQFISLHFPDFQLILADITKDILNNPTNNFVTIYTEPWYYKNFITVIGDAAHGFNPFSGQGVSAAIADVMTLMDLIDKHGSDWTTIFPLYQQTRKKHTDVLATLSKEGIAEYKRHTKADYALIYNKLDEVLYTSFPNLFNAPPYVHLKTNPLLAGSYLEKHMKQRKKARWFGVPIAVGIVTGLVAVGEKMELFFKKQK